MLLSVPDQAVLISQKISQVSVMLMILIHRVESQVRNFSVDVNDSNGNQASFCLEKVEKSL